MSDNVSVTAGSGSNFRTLEDTSNIHWPASVIGLPTTVSPGANVVVPVNADNPLPVTLDNGGVAHDAVDSGNPSKIGGKAHTSNPTAVANNDRANAMFDVIGRLVVGLDSLDENLVNGNASATDTSNTSVIAAQGAGSRIITTCFVVTNASATDTEAIIKSATTEKLRITAPANSGAIVPFRLRCGDNEALQFAAADSVTTLYVAAAGYVGR